MKLFFIAIAITLLCSLCNCTRPVMYVRHGEPCNASVYDCIQIDSIK
jgi:hypothetical protein